MANTLAANGFQQFGKVEGAAPTVGLITRKIASGNTNAIGFGDPVIPLTTGYIDIAANAGSTQLAGIFYGCKYFNTAVGRVVWSKSWPGSGATGDVLAYLDNDPNSLFQVQVASATGTGVLFADIGDNINVKINTPQTEAAGGFSTSGVDQGTLANTATLPFRVWALLSTYIIGQNGTDDTSDNNRIIVRFNNVDRLQLTGIH
jgi:hypothetical protein